MQATLLNFGACTRVVCDVKNNPVAIDIGMIAEDVDIHDAHFHMIKRAIQTDTLMVVPKDARISDKLKEVISLLRSTATDSYESVLESFNKVVPFDEDNSLRPTRERMLAALCDLARFEVAKALHITSQVKITEEGDKVTRQEVPKSPTGDMRAPGDLPDPPPVVKRQRGPKPIVKKAAARSDPKKSNKKSKPKPQPVLKTRVARERL